MCLAVVTLHQALPPSLGQYSSLLPFSVILPILGISCTWSYYMWPLASGFFNLTIMFSKFTHMVAWICIYD